MNYEELIRKVKTYNKRDYNIVEKAYKYAKKYHGNQTRLSGESYITHPVSVAYILASLKADSSTICAALLHDIIEDTEVTYDDVVKNFNKDVADLVDGVTKLSSINFNSKAEVNADYQRRLIINLYKDPRILIIKLADRLHNMRTLEFKEPEKQKRIALETLDIYVPMAHYLGIYVIKNELENLSFKYLKPNECNELINKLRNIRNENLKLLNKMIINLKNELNKHEIKATLSIYLKDEYSVYKKLNLKNTIDNIHDLIGIKVITSNVKDCYLALMCIHSLNKPFTNKFKDYIMNPKSNRYQALHTTVFTENNRLVQYQIRTKEMEKIANYGVAYHWLKDGNNAKKVMVEQMSKQNDLISIINEIDSTITDNIEFVNTIKSQLFSSTVYVRTTKGDTIELPIGSTPIDFAYKIHSDIGNTMIAAIVNDNVVPFDYKLSSGDRIRIITDINAKVDRTDWINKAVTLHAKREIQDFIKGKE